MKFKSPCILSYKTHVALFYHCPSFYKCVCIFRTKKEKELYSYLQQLINQNTSSHDLVIEQFSNRDGTLNWQAVIKGEGDSCYVIFLPPQYAQDTMLPGELTPINRFKISKKVLLSRLEQEKKHAANKGLKAVQLSIRSPNYKEFRVGEMKGLYTILRYNTSTDYKDE